MNVIFMIIIIFQNIIASSNECSICILHIILKIIAKNSQTENSKNVVVNCNEVNCTEIRVIKNCSTCFKCTLNNISSQTKISFIEITIIPFQ